jgi:sugar phosphate permease
MDAPTSALFLLAGVLLLIPGVRKTLWKVLQRFLRKLFTSPARGKAATVLTIWWTMAIAIVTLSAIPLVFSLTITTAHIWLWVFVPPLVAFLVKSLFRLRTRRRVPRKKRLPRRGRWLRR